MHEYLREAAEADLELLLAWANDPQVRNNSFSTAQISREEHQEWFRKLQRDPDRKQYIFMAGQTPVGQIRVAVEADSAEIGYSVFREYRGRGYGKKMLALLPGQLKQDFPGVRVLTARVKEGNTASEQAFLKSGYHRTSTSFACELGCVHE